MSTLVERCREAFPGLEWTGCAGYNNNRAALGVVVGKIAPARLHVERLPHTPEGCRITFLTDHERREIQFHRPRDFDRLRRVHVASVVWRENNRLRAAEMPQPSGWKDPEVWGEHRDACVLAGTVLLGALEEEN